MRRNTSANASNKRNTFIFKRFTSISIDSIIKRLLVFNIFTAIASNRLALFEVVGRGRSSASMRVEDKRKTRKRKQTNSADCCSLFSLLVRIKHYQFSFTWAFRIQLLSRNFFFLKKKKERFFPFFVILAMQYIFFFTYLRINISLGMVV